MTDYDGVSTESATERLRRMLDERGVEYTQTVVTEGVLFTVVTGEEHYFVLVRDNDAGIEMWSQHLTPEQAIAATLGRKEYVYALTAIDPEDGREYVLGLYATRELVEKSIETNGRGYALHYVSRWEVVDE